MRLNQSMGRDPTEKLKKSQLPELSFLAGSIAGFPTSLYHPKPNERSTAAMS